MKVNVVYAHPAEDSYLASLHRRIVEVMKARGDEVVDFDLYAMKFDPVMQSAELKGHADLSLPGPLEQPQHDVAGALPAPLVDDAVE